MLSPFVIRNSVLRSTFSSCLPITPHLKAICWSGLSTYRLAYKLSPYNAFPAFRIVSSSFNLTAYYLNSSRRSFSSTCLSQMLLTSSMRVSRMCAEALFSRRYLRSASSRKASSSSLNTFSLTFRRSCERRMHRRCVIWLR